MTTGCPAALAATDHDRRLPKGKQGIRFRCEKHLRLHLLQGSCYCRVSKV